jgi:hypothetical protein
MWAQLSLAVVKISRPRNVGATWNSYVGVRRAIEVTKQLSPIPPKTLHTLNACPQSAQPIDIEDITSNTRQLSFNGKITSLDMKFRCPLVLEALTLVEPGVAACHMCNKRVYKVQTQEELDERAKKGDCVWMEPKNLDPEAKVNMKVEVAVFGEDLDQILRILALVAQDRRVVERSASMLPYFTIKLLGAPGMSFTVRFTIFCVAPSSSNGAQRSKKVFNQHTEGVAPLPRRFTFLWFHAPPEVTGDGERRSWEPTLHLGDLKSRTPSEAEKIALATVILRQAGIPRSYEPDPKVFLSEVLEKVDPPFLSRRDDIIMGGIRRPPTPPPTSRFQKIGCGGKRCVIQ